MSDDPPADPNQDPNQGEMTPEEVLDQGMIDALMEEATSGLGERIYRPDGELFARGEKVNVEDYDFRNPVFLTELELRQVRIRHEQFIHYLAARLSMFLRMDFGLKMSKLFTAQYSKFTEAIPNPAYINLFRVNESPGIGVLSVNPRLAMTLTDRMLGGKGHSIRDERYLTEIEIALMEDLVEVVLEEWCRQWDDVLPMTASTIGTENNGRFLATAPHDSIMLVLSMEGSLGDCSEEMMIGIPYYTVEPVIKNLQERNRMYQKNYAVERTAAWRETYASIQVPVVAEWHAFTAGVEDVLGLRVGDIVELPSQILSQTTLKIVDSPKFVGEVGLDDEQVAVRIVEVLRDNED